MPARDVELHLNYRGVGRIATNPLAKLAVTVEAQRAKAIAEAIAPRQTGNYDRSFSINLHVRRDWPPSSPHKSKRACADLINSDPGAIVIEKGGVRVYASGKRVAYPAHRTMQRTLEYMRARGKGQRGVAVVS